MADQIPLNEASELLQRSPVLLRRWLKARRIEGRHTEAGWTISPSGVVQALRIQRRQRKQRDERRDPT